MSSSGRISLSSSVFVDRVKKFDTYEHNRRASKRATVQKSRVVSDVSLPINRNLSKQRFEEKTWLNSEYLKKPVSPKKNIQKPTPATKIRKQKLEFGSKNIQQPKAHMLALEAVGNTPTVSKSIIADQFQRRNLSSKKHKKHKQSVFQIIMYSMATFVFVFASAVSVQTLLTNLQTQEQLGVLGEQTHAEDEQGVAQGTGNDPAESPVSNQVIIDYQVSAELPRYLRIPDIDVFARIKHTGIDPVGAVDAPGNIHDVSWYNESAKPGNEIGASLLLGHVSGWSGPGVFKNIDKLKTGSRFEVEKGSGETVIYEVTKGVKIPLNEVNMASILSSENAIEHDMKLMTCTGSYSSVTGTYDSRYVVYAKILR